MRNVRRFLGDELELRAREEREPRMRRLIAHDQRIEPAGFPLLDRIVRRQKMIAPQVEQHSLLAPADHGEAPIMLLGFPPNAARKPHQRIAPSMVALADFPCHITAGENGRRRSAPSSTTPAPFRATVRIGTAAATCAPNNKQSGGITGKIRSTRFDGMTDMRSRPPTLQQTSQSVSGRQRRARGVARTRWQTRSAGRSREPICGADAGDKNRAAAAYESSR